MFKINNSTIHNFDQKEFSEDPIKYADSIIIKSLDYYRNKIGKLIYPSPEKGSLARVDGSETSQHYIGNWANPVRKSKAIDFFCEGYPILNLLFLIRMQVFSGIGVYLDTTGPDGKSWVMFHADNRPPLTSQLDPLIWICTKNDKMENVYTYNYDVNKFTELMQNERLFKNKQYGIEPASKFS